MKASTPGHSSRPGATRVRATLGWGLVAASLGTAYHEILQLSAPDVSAAQQTAAPVDSSPHLVLILLLGALAIRRADLRRAAAEPGRMAAACALLVPGALLLLWAHYLGARDLLLPSLVLAILGSGWLLAGPRMCRTLLPCAALLLFAMPIPAVPRNQLVHALQIASAQLTSGLLDLIGVAHVRTGDVLELGASSFQVVEECSGIASIGALSLAAMFYIGLFRNTPLQAALLLAVAPLIGLLANAVRVLWLTLQNPSGAREPHAIQGLAVIACGALALGVVDRLLGRIPALRAEARPPVPGPPRFPGLLRRRVLTLCAAYGALGLALFALPTRVRAPGDAAERIARIAAALQDAGGEDVETDREFRGSTGFHASLHRSFPLEGQPVTVFVGIDDRSDRLVSGRSPKTVFPGSRWLVVERQPLALQATGADGEALVLRNSTGWVLVYHWTTGFESLVSETLRSLVGLEPRRAAPRPGVVVRLSTPLRSGAAARARAATRLRRMAAKLQESGALQ